MEKHGKRPIVEGRSESDDEERYSPPLCGHTACDAAPRVVADVDAELIALCRENIKLKREMGKSTTSCVRVDASEETRKYSLRVCKMINAAAPSLVQCSLNDEDVPDGFMLFTLANNMRIFSSVMSAIVSSSLSALVNNAEIDDSAEAKKAQENIDSIFRAFNEQSTRVKDIAVHMPHDNANRRSSKE